MRLALALEPPSVVSDALRTISRATVSAALERVERDLNDSVGAQTSTD